MGEAHVATSGAEASGFSLAVTTVEAWDVALSSYIFKLELPDVLEVALSVPGYWFGCAPYVLLAVPTTLLVVAPQAWSYRTLVLLPVLLAALSVWLMLCARSMSDGDGVSRAYLSAYPGPLLSCFLLVPHAVLTVAAFGDAAGFEAAAIFYCSYFPANIAVDALKVAVGRPRPLLLPEVASVRRFLSDAFRQQAQPKEVVKSFPSGDALNAGIWAGAMVHALQDASSRRCWAPVLGAAMLGRVYFHCHHLLDVVVGAALGLGSATFTAVLSRRLGPPGRRHVLLLQVLSAPLAAALHEVAARLSGVK